MTEEEKTTFTVPIPRKGIVETFKDFFSWLQSKRKKEYREGLTIKGEFEAILFDKHGNVKARRQKKNLIVTAGLNAVRQSIMKSASRPAVFDYCAIGSGTTNPAAGDTALETELARVQGTYSEPGSAQGKISTTFGAGVGTGAVTEYGLLNAAAAGTLYNRVEDTVVNKGASDSLIVNFTFTYADA